jgi:hypothetical protein
MMKMELFITLTLIHAFLTSLVNQLESINQSINQSIEQTIEQTNEQTVSQSKIWLDWFHLIPFDSAPRYWSNGKFGGIVSPFTIRKTAIFHTLVAVRIHYAVHQEWRQARVCDIAITVPWGFSAVRITTATTTTTITNGIAFANVSRFYNSDTFSDVTILMLGQ